MSNTSVSVRGIYIFLYAIVKEPYGHTAGSVYEIIIIIIYFFITSNRGSVPHRVS